MLGQVIIPLTQGKVAVVDAAFGALREHAWRAVRNHNTWYAQTRMARDGRPRTVYLHQLVMAAELRRNPGRLVDHKDGDGLNNTVANLRLSTNRENQRNSRRRWDNSSGYKGVSRHRSGRWQARITADGRQRHLGYFDAPEAAAAAYDAAARDLFGEFARPNT